jgi:hypothetical protein
LTDLIEEDDEAPYPPEERFSSDQVYFHPDGHDHSGGEDYLTFGSVSKSAFDLNACNFLWGNLFGSGLGPGVEKIILCSGSVSVACTTDIGTGYYTGTSVVDLSLAGTDLDVSGYTSVGYPTTGWVPIALIPCFESSTLGQTKVHSLVVGIHSGAWYINMVAASSFTVNVDFIVVMKR